MTTTHTIDTHTDTAPAIRPRAIDTPAAARYMGISQEFLRQARIYGNRDGRTPGPPFIRIGRKVMYLVDDLDRWLEGRRVQRSRVA